MTMPTLNHLPFGEAKPIPFDEKREEGEEADAEVETAPHQHPCASGGLKVEQEL